MIYRRSLIRPARNLYPLKPSLSRTSDTESEADNFSSIPLPNVSEDVPLKASKDHSEERFGPIDILGFRIQIDEIIIIGLIILLLQNKIEDELLLLILVYLLLR